MNREQVIERLVSNLKDTLANDDGYLESLLRAGFRGFDNFTDEELVHEYRCQFDREPS